MDATLRIDGHLVFFKVEIGHALPQDANQQVVRELVLIGEAVGRDGLKALQKGCIAFVTSPDGIERIVVEPVVVAVVAESGRTFGKVAQIGFVLFVENSVLNREAFGDRFGTLGKNGPGRDQQQESKESAHRGISVTERTGMLQLPRSLRASPLFQQLAGRLSFRVGDRNSRTSCPRSALTLRHRAAPSRLRQDLEHRAGVAGTTLSGSDGGVSEPRSILIRLATSRPRQLVSGR